MTIDGGLYDGTTGSGSFSYNTSVFVTGNEVLTPSFGNLSVSMTILGQTFTQANDVDFPTYPQLTFSGFAPSLMNYLIREEVKNPTAINQPGVSEINFIFALAPATAGYTSIGTIAAVPEPSSFALIFAMSSLLGFRRGRRVS